jgi:serine protease AprX
MSKKQKIFQISMALILTISLLASAAAFSNDQPARLQPVLAQMAAETPDETVRVIVQKADETDKAESLVEKLGGIVTTDLQMINAFAAELSAEALLYLARSAAVFWVSLDAPVISTARGGNGGGGGSGGDPLPENYFLDTLGVRQVWELGYQGEGVTVAVIDSGIRKEKDFEIDPSRNQPSTRILERKSFNPDSTSPEDLYGHGTHVAGIVGGSGYKSDGAFAGIAPKINLISLKISDDVGQAYESDTVEALQWVFDHKDEYNIRVVNLSIQSTVESTYHESGVDLAAEILWFNGVVVVVSAGNKGPGGNFNTIHAAPANDPFVITVGASDERNTPERSDDTVTPFTAHGYTPDGIWKPEIIAPGQDIISVLSIDGDWRFDYPDRLVQGREYFRLSGTSMAAPMVAGAAALLLQAEPDLTPDQVKHRLIATSDWIGSHHYMDVYAALTTPTSEIANQGVMPHIMLAKMAMIAYWASETGEGNIDWENIDWAAVNWNAVNWNAVNWNAVNWNAVNWNAVNWNAVNWSAVNWSAVNWNAVNWSAVNWSAVNWNAVNWNAVNWNADHWND